MEPLEPKAWDGRWLAIKFNPGTKAESAHYGLFEVQRARDQYHAAVLAQQIYGFQEDTHFLIVALPAEIITTLENVSVDLEMPGPRWYRVATSAQGLYPRQESEDAWIRETQKEWYPPKEVATAV